MNVLLINHEKPPIGGGGGVFTNLLGKGLAALGQKVYFLTIGARDDIIEEASGYFVITINTNRKNYANIKFDNFLKFLIKFPSAINRIIKDYNIDIVNPHFIHTAGLANYLSGNKLNYIISALGADIYDPTRYKFIRFFMNMLSEKILTDSCYIVLSSQDMYERAAANFPQFKSKLKIIPHCINKD
ncbi:MAG TPA: glycosyltransferase, partial [bacterium]|nr:glycosyltransferase [bacterium]